MHEYKSENTLWNKSFLPYTYVKICGVVGKSFIIYYLLLHKTY